MRRDYKNINNLTILLGAGIPDEFRDELPTLCLGDEYVVFTASWFKNIYTKSIMKKINESFTCINCKKEIPLADKTCRNHCPYCFTSLHVDWDIPWDRASDCHWIMKPINYEIRNWTMKILFKCTKCGKLHRNKRAVDDDIEILLKLVKENQNL